MFGASQTRLSLELQDSATSNSGAIRRNLKSPGTLVERPEEGINTLFDILQRGFAMYPSKPTFGSRRVQRIIEEQKEVTKKVPGGGEVKEMKTWKFFELSGYEWLTWGEAKVLTTAYASGLRALGMKKGDKLTIFADTSREWMFCAMSCILQGITVTTAYATLGEDGLAYSVQECEVPTIFTNAELLPVIYKIASKCPTLKNIIYHGTADQAVLEKLASDAKHFTVLSLNDLKALGEKNPVDPVQSDKEDLALIMYTSGSTGPPKGVMLTHANVVATIAGCVFQIGDHVNDQDTYLAYLPLAHILEFAVEMAVLYFGCELGYGGVKTLTDGSVRNCKGDIRELRPTVLAGVPAVWEGIRKAVESKIRSSSTITQRVFDGCFGLKSLLLSNGLGILAAPLDAIVFNKIKDQVGGRLKFAISGGAPIPKSTHEFLNVAVATVIQGYGMTEACGIVALQEVWQSATLGITGAPFPNMEMKLVDVENTSYKSTNVPKPQGEIWVRGANVMKGYFKQPALTREVLTEDGWMMTGDIGEWNTDGTLSIIDRKKNLVKLANGEYIALEKLESMYKTSKFVQNICVYADPEQTYPVALIQPIEKELKATAAALDKNVTAEHELEELCSRKDIKNAVLASFAEIHKATKLQGAEKIGAVFISKEEWTPQNGLLTAAMKLQRKQITTTYAKEIKAMYSQ
ncbi:long-chain fatty acid-CoA ligase [Rhizoclosmatium sp. JEL0117]|nr:long-chain fatty acid-CoA ligase [Rhizoclosmatium sp. JEL0117]